MKRVLIFGALLLSIVGKVIADEGMWLPLLLADKQADMQKNGMKITAEDIYSANKSSLKDAVVLFGRGCTGESVSAEGLLLTNHHCGYGSIVRHSTVEHDYLTNGFWAKNKQEELPCAGMSVTLLVYMKDVTKEVLQGVGDNISEEEREKLIERNIAAIRKKAVEGTHYEAVIKPFYYGNQYFMYVNEVFNDVRLVGAPPSNIGKFGGDTDNWMWPRHTGDFSLFRIYADKDNNPAEYSKDNVPYQPKKYFKISTAGVKEGDFTFIYGFPGYTQEYIHSEGVRYISEISDPSKVALRTLRLNIMNKHMGQSQAVRIQYSTKKAIVANAWKKWQGEAGGIKKMKTVQTNQDYEKRFTEWAKGTEYEGVVEKIDSLYKKLEAHHFIVDVFSETAQTIEIARLARQISGHDLPTVKKICKSFFKDYYMPIDKECFVALMTEFGKMIPVHHQPEFYKEQVAKFGTIQTWADSLFANSIFTDEAKMESLGENYKDVLRHDPASEYYIEMQNWALPHLNKARALNNDLKLLYRTYMRGQMDFAPDRTVYYPDANLTLRVSYGHIKGYSPYDGAYYHPSSTLKGIIEKDNPDIFDYNIPQKLRDIYHNRDFGRWVDENGEVPVCFIATNHTTGGNSGSPVINAEGHLIGINFDRVWEGTMSDIDFDMDFCRNISLDIRYVLFTIEKIGGAAYLFDEMTFIE